MQRMGVDPVGMLVSEVVPHPELEGREGKHPFDALHYHHGELEAVPGAEVEALP